jgi:hypothetical protein
MGERYRDRVLDLEASASIFRSLLKRIDIYFAWPGRVFTQGRAV